MTSTRLKTTALALIAGATALVTQTVAMPAEAAKRALAEADARRKEAEKAAKPKVKEILGRDGPDPVRFGDWEKDGLISDF